MEAQRNTKPWWMSTWAKIVGALLLVGWVVDVAGFVELVKPLGQVVGDVADWLYPFWLTIGLAVLLLVTVVTVVFLYGRLKVEGRARAAAEHRATEAEAEALRRNEPDRGKHDTRILRALRTTLSRSDINYWREVDFGGTWHGTRTHQLMELHFDRDAVEDCFLDPELERLRRDLMSAARALMEGAGQWGGRSKAGPGLYDLGGLDGIGLFDEQHREHFEEQWEAHREELGRRADRLVETYDALIAEAQERLPAAFEDAPVAEAPPS